MEIPTTEGSTAAETHSGTRREGRSRIKEVVPFSLDPDLESEGLKLPPSFCRLNSSYADESESATDLELELLTSFGLERERAGFLIRQVHFDVNADEDPFFPSFEARSMDRRLPAVAHDTVGMTISNYRYSQGGWSASEDIPEAGMFYFYCMIRIGDPSTKIIRDFARWVKQQKATFKVLDVARARRKEGYFRRDLVVFALSQEPGWNKHSIVTQLDHMNLKPLVGDTRSTTEPNPEKSSVVIQQQHCIREIWKRALEGWVHRVTLSDPCCSGCSSDRLGLRLLLELALARKIKVVVVYRRDRLFRNAELMAQIQAVFDTHGVKVVSCVEGMHDGAPHSELMRQFIEANAQFECANIKRRLNDRLKYAAKKGDWKGGTPSFGYKYERGSKTLTAEKREAKIVKYIFEQIAAGVAIAELVPELRKRKLFGRRSKWAKSELRPVRPVFLNGAMIRGIVDNPVYRGVVRVRRLNQEVSPAVKPGVEWDEFKGRHVALVSDETWFRANELLSGSRQSAGSEGTSTSPSRSLPAAHAILPLNGGKRLKKRNPRKEDNA